MSIESHLPEKASRRAGTRRSAVQELVAQVHAGDKRAFGRLIHELEPFVKGTSMKVCRDREVADETAQDTYVAIHRSLDQFKGAASFTTWLYTVIVNNCRMKHRRRMIDQASVPLEEAGEELAFSGRGAGARDWNEGPEASLLADELRDVLGRAISRLPEEYESVFVLRQLEQLSTKQTADELGLSEAAVKSRLHRARAIVRREVESRYADVGGMA